MNSKAIPTTPAMVRCAEFLPITDEHTEAALEWIRTKMTYPKFESHFIEVHPGKPGGTVFIVSSPNSKRTGFRYVLELPNYALGQAKQPELWQFSQGVADFLTVAKRLRHCKSQKDRDIVMRDLFPAISDLEELDDQLHRAADEHESVFPSLDDVADAYAMVIPEVML